MFTVSKAILSCILHALRYSFLSFMQTASAVLFQYVNTCIHIPVMDHVTFWALPDTNAQIFTSGFRQPQKLQVWLLGYIVGTLRIHFHTKSPYIPAFQKLCPGNTCYGFCQFMVPDHSFHIQIFDTDGLVHAPAALTVSAGNHSFDWLSSHVLWLL